MPFVVEIRYKNIRKTSMREDISTLSIFIIVHLCRSKYLPMGSK